jgi:hypothetical protein
MTLDHLVVGMVLVALFLAFLSLLIGKGFIRRGNWTPALQTQWYVTVALVFCFALALITMDRRTQDLQERVDELNERLEKYQEDEQ